jgi:DNA-directed RNA polymerase omega subunit
MKYPLEEMLNKVDNRYALIQIISQRSRELRDRDETMLISKAIDHAIDDFLGDHIAFTDTEK